MSIEKSVFSKADDNGVIEYHVYSLDRDDNINVIWKLAEAEGFKDSDMPDIIHDLTYDPDESPREVIGATARILAVTEYDGYKVKPGVFNCVYIRKIQAQTSQDTSDEMPT